MNDDIEVTGIDENPAPPAAVQLDAATIGMLAAELGKSVRQAIPQQPQPRYQPQQEPSFLDAWRANQIRNGANEQQLDELIMMMEASNRDQQMKQRRAAESQAAEQSHYAFWGTVEEAFEELAESMPAIRKAKDGFFQDFYNVLQSNDSRFIQIASHVNSGGKLSKPQALKVLAPLVDDYLKQIGAARTSAPVSTKGSSPTQAGRTTNGDRPVFLDAEQELFYRQFRGELGDEAARELARQFKQE